GTRAVPGGSGGGMPGSGGWVGLGFGRFFSGARLSQSCSACVVVSEECFEDSVDGRLNFSIHGESATDSQDGIQVRADQHGLRAYGNWPLDFKGERESDDRHWYVESPACGRIDGHR